jgi:chromosome segregation ATPase
MKMSTIHKTIYCIRLNFMDEAVNDAFAALELAVSSWRQSLSFASAQLEARAVTAEAHVAALEDQVSILSREVEASRALVEKSREELAMERETGADLRRLLDQALEEARELRKVSRLIAYENEMSRLQSENARLARELEKARTLPKKTDSLREARDRESQELKDKEREELLQQVNSLQEEIAVLTGLLKRSRSRK